MEKAKSKPKEPVIFAVDPAAARDFDHQAYRAIYSDSFIKAISEKIGLESKHFELLKFSILNAASNYEMAKRYSEFKEKPFHIEDAKLKKLAEKAAEFKEAYMDAINTGSAFGSMIFKCSEQDFLKNKHPRSSIMFQAM